MGEIFSPGKLMLTSEYFAVDGALVLAIPTKLGQEFFFEEKQDEKSLVFWEAYHQDKLWLKAVIDYKSWQILEANIPPSAEFILKTLKNVQQLSETKFKNNFTYHLKTNLQFPADIGALDAAARPADAGDRRTAAAPANRQRHGPPAALGVVAAQADAPALITGRCSAAPPT